MLTFVGLGLYDECSVTIAGRKAIRSCDRAFAEFYTSDLVGTTVEDLAAHHDVDVEVRDRAGIERDPEPVLNAAETEEVCFLAAGDAMVSTTHVDLRLRAEDRGIETRVVHGVSAASRPRALRAPELSVREVRHPPLPGRSWRRGGAAVSRRER